VSYELKAGMAGEHPRQRQPPLDGQHRVTARDSGCEQTHT
jgi:hypothetical protein